MLKKSLQIAIPFGQLLTQKGVQLNIGRSSHLSSLFATGTPDNPKPQIAADEFINSVEYVTSVASGISEYEGFDLALKDELKPLVTSHIQMSRAIGQIAKGLSEKVQGYLADMPVEGALSNFNIVQDDLPSLFDFPSVMGTMENTPKQLGRVRLENLVSGPRDADSVADYLASGKKEQDAAVLEAIEFYGKNFLLDIWHTLFYPGSGLAVNGALLASKPAGERATFFLLGGLIADRLFNEVPKDGMGSLSYFQNQASNIRDWAMQNAAIAYQEHQANVQNKTLALSYRPDTKTVVVCAPVYKEWLLKGGAAEVVLGSLLSNLRSYTVDDFANRADEHLKSWNSYCTFHNSAADSRRATLLRSTWLMAFASDIGNIQGFEEGYRKANPSHAEKCIEQARQYLDTKGLMALEQGTHVALHLVAKIRFGYTPAYDFLNDIDQVLAKNVDADVREAALVAATKYIARYLASQILVTRTK